MDDRVAVAVETRQTQAESASTKLLSKFAVPASMAMLNGSAN